MGPRTVRPPHRLLPSMGWDAANSAIRRGFDLARELYYRGHMVRRLIPSLILSLSLLACGGGDSSGGPDGGGGGGADGGGGVGGSDSFFPIAMGGSWTYRVTDTATGVTANKTQTVDAFEDVGGAKAGTMAYRLTTSKPSGKETVSWQGIEGDRLVRYREQTFDNQGAMATDETYEPSKLRMDGAADHITVGASYHDVYVESLHTVATNLDTTVNKDDLWVVEQVDASVTVPAGTFNAIVVHKTNAVTGSDKRYWFVSGVGKVREEGAGQIEQLADFTMP
jgi:hypothetical protein